MTLLLNLCVWLCQNPRVVRLWLTTRALLRALVECLVDIDAGRPRDLRLGATPLIERYLQLVEACLTRLLWLRAMEIANLRIAPVAGKFIYIPPRRIRAADACAAHALSLLDRFARLEPLARRLAARLTKPTDATNSSTFSGAVPQCPKTPPILILMTREARGLKGWPHAHHRPAATLIPQTGPPWRYPPQHTLNHPTRSAIPRFRRRLRTPEDRLS